MFRRYDHVERLKNDKVEGIECGDVYVFPKLDGTNASVWLELTEFGALHVHCGSRTRQLSEDSDNAGFYKWVHEHENKVKFHKVHSEGGRDWVIYGEWLVPHTLKTYRQEAWRKFYVFDVYDRNQGKYLSYEKWEPTIRGVGLDVIEPLCVYTNPTDEQLQREAEQNTYLILDGAGCGEGIVLKNYEWANREGNQIWAKIVRNEFKEENKRAFGTTEKNGEFQVEAAIAEEYVTQALVEKTRSKIVIELTDQDIIAGLETRPECADPDFLEKFYDVYKRVEERHRAKLIPQLLGTVYHDLINEELWTAIKQYKNPTIDFKKLQSYCILYTKRYAADLF